LPADGVLLEGQDFFVSQAVLTGETFPIEKKVANKVGEVAAKAGLVERINCVFMRTGVRSGTAHALIAQTGAHTG
jgi:P-type Mg2+ transporter